MERKIKFDSTWERAVENMLEYVEYKWHLNGVPNFFFFSKLLFSSTTSPRTRKGKVEKFTLWTSLSSSQAKSSSGALTCLLHEKITRKWYKKKEENEKKEKKKESTDADDVDKAEWMVKGLSNVDCRIRFI